MKLTEENLRSLGLSPNSDTEITMCISADINDGDYLTDVHTISSYKTALKAYEIARKIMSHRGDWCDPETYLTEDEIEEFSDYIPYLDNESVHTIESITFSAILDGQAYS